ncbi:hypothetical protein Syun_017224 [Stephania yunnanensis]|uniref:Uncharacterized protein n=1 Tax=Stephania yunnanensis TaxID=152371 RepID=A0AAP0J654_9MAGN
MPSFKTPLSDEFFEILTKKLGQLKISSPTIPSSSANLPPPAPSPKDKGPAKDKGPVIMTLSPASTPPATQGELSPASPMPNSSDDNEDILPEIHRIIRSHACITVFYTFVYSCEHSLLQLPSSCPCLIRPAHLQQQLFYSSAAAFLLVSSP